MKKKTREKKISEDDINHTGVRSVHTSASHVVKVRVLVHKLCRAVVHTISTSASTRCLPSFPHVGLCLPVLLHVVYMSFYTLANVLALYTCACTHSGSQVVHVHARPQHCGTNLGNFDTSIIHFPTSDANERTNQRTDERLYQYFRPDSFLFCTTVLTHAQRGHHVFSVLWKDRS